MTLKEIYQALTGGFAELKASHEALAKSFAANQEEAATLKTQVKALSSENADLRTENEQLSQAKEGLETEKATLETENTELKEKVGGIPQERAQAGAEALADQGLTAEESEGSGEGGEAALTAESYASLSTQERVNLLRTRRAEVLALR